MHINSITEGRMFMMFSTWLTIGLTCTCSAPSPTAWVGHAPPAQELYSTDEHPSVLTNAIPPGLRRILCQTRKCVPLPNDYDGDNCTDLLCFDDSLQNSTLVRLVSSRDGTTLAQRSLPVELQGRFEYSHLRDLDGDAKADLAIAISSRRTSADVSAQGYLAILSSHDLSLQGPISSPEDAESFGSACRLVDTESFDHPTVLVVGGTKLLPTAKGIRERVWCEWRFGLESHDLISSEVFPENSSGRSLFYHNGPTRGFDADSDGVDEGIELLPTKDLAPTPLRIFSRSSGETLEIIFPPACLNIGSVFPGDLKQIGDFDGDGIVDWADSDAGHNRLIERSDSKSSPAEDVGRVTIYSGLTGHPIFCLHGSSRYESCGRMVSGVRDVDGDHYADIVVQSGQSVMLYSGHLLYSPH